MRHQKITTGQLAAAIGFAFSCFGLLLFLWVSFGGPIPFKPEGYRIEVPVDEGTQLAVKVIDIDPRRLEPKLSIKQHAEDEERRAHREYRKQLAKDSGFGTLGDLLAKLK